MSDIGRGSNSITGATDNQIYIERPTAKVNGKEREVDVSTERVITMRGRTVPESKIVIEGDTTGRQGLALAPSASLWTTPV